MPGGLSDRLAGEVEALAAAPEDTREQERLAGAAVRLALLSWDESGDAWVARRPLDFAKGHPLYPALAVDLAIATGTTDDMMRAEEAVSGLPAPSLDLAEAWLYRYRDPARAAALVRAALPKATGRSALELRALARLALALQEDRAVDLPVGPGAFDRRELPLHGGEPQALLAHLEALGTPVSLRRAAAVAESRAGDLSRAVSLADRAGGAGARLLRRSANRRALAAAHARHAESCEDPRAASALWCAAGAAFVSLELRDEAAEAFARAARLDPGDVASLEGVLTLDPADKERFAALESLYAAPGREAELASLLALRADAGVEPDERAALYLRAAKLHAGGGAIDRAIEAFEQAFISDPTNRNTFTAMEALCYEHRRVEALRALYQRTIELVEGGRVRAYRLVDLYQRLGQLERYYLRDADRAARAYRRVLELDPDREGAVTALEKIHRRKRDWRGMVDVYETQARLSADDRRRVDALHRAAQLSARKLREPERAAAFYEDVLTTAPENPEALEYLERFYEGRERWPDLVRILAARRAAAGDDVKEAIALHRRMAELCERKLRDEDGAIEQYRYIAALSPGDEETLEALARIYESVERWDDFIDVTRRLIRLSDDRTKKALLYFKCGSVMETKFEDEAKAIRHYDAAIKISPSCLPAVHGLRDLYIRRGDWERVIRTLELEAEQWPEEKERAGVLAQIGDIYARELGRPQKSLRYWMRAREVDPICLPANRSLFEHYFQAGRFEQARELAETLARGASRDGEPRVRSELYRKIGVVAMMCGDRATAAESFVGALEIEPDNLVALDALVELAREEPSVYDFATTLFELEKLYRKRPGADKLLARVLAAKASGLEREGDLDAAEALYEEALERVPGDPRVLGAVVDLHVAMRRWDLAAGAIERILGRAPSPPTEEVIRVLFRLAEIRGSGEMDPKKAIAALRGIIAVDVRNPEAYYRLAQELYLLGRYREAREAIERVIELRTQPGRDLSPEKLAGYYYYLGRILEADGEERAAAAHYWRAHEYDPGYAPPALLLSGRAFEAGERARAESLLIDAAHAAMEKRGKAAAVPLQRGLARIFVAAREPEAAIEAYRGILAVEADSAEDRVALAEVYAERELARAVRELQEVIKRDLRHGPAYRLLATFYARSGESERAARVLAVMEMLGYGEDRERAEAAGARASTGGGALHRPLNKEHRDLLETEAARTPLGLVYAQIADRVAAFFPAPALGENLAPASSADVLAAALGDSERLFAIAPKVLVGDRVPRGVVAATRPEPVVAIDRELCGEDQSALRFLLGWAFDAIRGGYAVLLTLGRKQRAELAMLLRDLFRPEKERPMPAAELCASLPPAMAKVIEEHAGGAPPGDVEAWIDETVATALRAGLFACDDIRAAARMIAHLSGEVLAGEEGASALGMVLCGADLIRFYLSDEYHQLREMLAGSAVSA